MRFAAFTDAAPVYIYSVNEYIKINELLVDGHNRHQDHNACGKLTISMSGQEANEWSIKTMKVNLAGSKERFDDSTTDSY